MQIIDGKALKDKLVSELGTEVKGNNLKLKLAIVLVGEDEPSLVYIRQKQKTAEQIGAESTLVHLAETVSQTELTDQIERLNEERSVTGIIVQLPLPRHLDKEKVLQTIKKEKDVDGLTKNSPFEPATPLGIMEILHEYKVPIKDKTAVVIGQSGLVGAPVSELLEKEGAKVIRIDINTPRPMDPLVQQGDIIVAAVGKPGLVTENMIKPGAVVIDVGTNRVPRSEISNQKSGPDNRSLIADYRIVGDVDFEKVSQKASLITPVPGGVGPVTVAMLMKNLVRSDSIDK